MAKPKKTKLEEAEELDKAVESYEKLLYICDGGNTRILTTFDATTFMAMMINHWYRAKVCKAHKKKYG